MIDNASTPSGIATVERRFHLGNQPGRRGGFRRVVRRGSEPPPEPVPMPAPVAAPPRIHPLARRMAMAIRCQQLIDTGAVADQADLAAVAGMTRAWVTVVMRMNLLAPEIQEGLLALPPDVLINHRGIDRITRHLAWGEQRCMWASLIRA